METDETIKKGFLRLERYAQNIPGGFHCCAEDPEKGMHHIHEFLHGRMYWQYKQEEIEWQDKNYNKFLHHV